MVDEKRWQYAWAEAELFVPSGPKDDATDVHILVSPPFTSGEAHIGHVRSYTIADAYARYQRARGASVLFSLGFDAFGLPAELGAIENGVGPRLWIERCCQRMRSQFDELGLSFDWSRSYVASESNIYRWSQWLFLKLLEADLVYRHTGRVDWCDSCRTALAHTQVQDGRCWRCDGPTRVRRRPQWYLKLSAYNEENDRRMANHTAWNHAAVTAQHAALGRVDGVEFDVKSADGSSLTVFTQFPDAIADAEFVAISPRYRDIDHWTKDLDVQQRLEKQTATEGQEGGAEPTGVATGAKAYIPGVQYAVPVVITAAVDARYGPTVVLGIPSVDETDRRIADGLPRVPTNNLRSKNMALEKRPAARFRAADFTISRQRAWGSPIPIVHCEGCGVVPVAIDELPVELPDDLTVTGEGSPLADHPEFSRCRCPACGEPARRETDTLDFHMDVSWCFVPFSVPKCERDEHMFEHPEVKRWLPASMVVYGADAGNFVLSQRMVSKALRDLGITDSLPYGEPYGSTVMHEMVQFDGRKMSKHLGNGVSPGDIVDRVGADPLRVAVLHAANPEKTITWDENVLRHCSRFLARLHEYAEPRLAAGMKVDMETSIDESTSARRRLARWCQTGILRITSNYETMALHRATRNIMALWERISSFEEAVLANSSKLTDRDQEAVVVSLLVLVRLMAPVAPHLAEELWAASGQDKFVSEAPWPEVGSEGLADARP